LNSYNHFWTLDFGIKALSAKCSTVVSEVIAEVPLAPPTLQTVTVPRHCGRIELEYDPMIRVQTDITCKRPPAL
jgi:hypothetical protein